MSEVIGELVATTSLDVVAQSCIPGQAPPFGSLVVIRADDVSAMFGVVYDIHTVGLDPGARPVMRGHEDVRDQSIYDANPDLDLVLRTEFSILLVGHSRGRTMHYVVPPVPPRLHWSVCLPSDAETVAFSTACRHFRRMLETPQIPADELVAAHIRFVAESSNLSDDFLVHAGRTLADLLRNDYARLRGIIDRIRPATMANRHV